MRKEIAAAENQAIASTSSTFSRRSTIVLTADFLATDSPMLLSVPASIIKAKPTSSSAAAGKEGLDWTALNGSSSSSSSVLAARNRRQMVRRRPNKCTCRFLWNTELHGITAFLKSRTLAERLFWGTIITVCLLLSVLTTEWMFDDYLDRQTATLITIEQRQRTEGVRGLRMPVLIVCPKNPDALQYNLVLKDIGRRLPRLDRPTIGRLISFAIAGAGFSNVGQFMSRRIVQHVSEQEAQRLYSLFRRWRGHRTLTEFYTDLFDKYGYSCKDMLQRCYYGAHEINCCDVFVPYYVMLRGRCMRLNHTLYQMDPADYGRIDIYLNQMTSRLTEPTGMQPQIIAYLTDKYRAVSTFPRYYVHFHSSVLLRARNRQINMLPGNSQCQTNPEDQGRNSCWLRRWLYEKVVEPYNCTVFYLGRNRYKEYPVCEPIVLVRNYLSVIDLRLDNDTRKRCLPACSRTEHIFQEFRPKTSALRRNYVPAFRVEMYYTNLEIELYQEVLTTTLPGFISQLGGQSGLFVGLSVCSIFQIGISLIWKCHRWYERHFGHAVREERRRRRQRQEQQQRRSALFSWLERRQQPQLESQGTVESNTSGWG